MHFSDIDECFVEQDNCDDDRASCNNTFGSFSCECNLGYSGDGTIGNCGKLECDRGMCNVGLFASCYLQSNMIPRLCCTDCQNGDVLLMNGSVPTSSQREGRVEICYNNEYHTICDDLWDERDARVVCRKLNISGDSKMFVFLFVFLL